MAAPEINVSYVANLAHLELTDEETERFSAQLADILGYVRKLESLDVEGIEPMAHANPVYDVMRDDESRPGDGAETALRNAPARGAEGFKVTRVVE